MRRVIDEAVFHITPDESSGAQDSIPFARAMEIMQGLTSIVSGLADAHIGDDTDSRSVLRPTEDAQELRVKLNGSGKKQFVGYSQELEERTLHEVRNEQQKITCTVVFSPNGAIEKIDSIDKMSVLQLRSIEVASFDIDGRTIRFKEPIRLQEQLDADAGSMIYVEYPDLALVVFAEFQDDMEELIHEELANKWEWIVESDDDELAEDALEIKRRFLSITEEG